MTASGRATAVAHPNIALIKYWGNLDSELRIPANGSISMTLSGLQTKTTVRFDPQAAEDEVLIDRHPASAEARRRVVRVLDRVRHLALRPHRAHVESANSFPSDAGIASSASAFAALAAAAAAAAGLDLEPRTLSRLARLGSGSACRSVYGGFVEWVAGVDDESSYAVQIAPPEYWDVRDLVAIVSRDRKQVGSSEGHRRAGTSPRQSARVQDAPRRLDACRRALLARDFDALAAIVEEDSRWMHDVMKTSVPPLDYSSPLTLQLASKVPEWRAEGLAVAYTQDAGPNLHLLCLASVVEPVSERLRKTQGVLDVLLAGPGTPPQILEDDLSG
jgi:diphosphomevalonate decarboxylase